MKLPTLAAITGFTAFAIATLGVRMLAPYHGLTPFLTTAVAVVALAALALATFLGARASLSGAGVAAVLAAAWTMALPWIRTPLLTALDPIGIAGAAVIGALLLVGVPLAAAGVALPVALRLSAPTLERVPRAAGIALASALAGALIAAIIVPLLLVPSLGTRRATLAVALIELGAAALALGGRRAVTAPALLAVAAAGLMASGLSAMPRAPKLGLNEVRDGRAAELRVIDRNGARYMLAGGTMRAVVSLDDFRPLTRTAAALELLKLLHPSRDTVLMLGLRGGAVARSFAREGWAVHVVDPDGTEAQVSAAWMRLRPEDARITVSDPRVFLRGRTDTYAVVVLDAFGDAAFPFHLASAQFVDLLAARLRPDGVVAIPIETQGWDDVVVRSLAATLRRRFPVVQALPTSEPPNALGTIVLVASRRPLAIPDERLPDPSLHEYHMDAEGQWIVQQMNHAWLNRYEPVPDGATVLTDDGRLVDLWGERLNAASRRELHAFFGAGGRSW